MDVMDSSLHMHRRETTRRRKGTGTPLCALSEEGPEAFSAPSRATSAVAATVPVRRHHDAWVRVRRPERRSGRASVRMPLGTSLRRDRPRIRIMETVAATDPSLGGTGGFIRRVHVETWPNMP